MYIGGITAQGCGHPWNGFYWRYTCALHWAGILDIEDGLYSVACCRRCTMAATRLAALVALEPMLVLVMDEVLGQVIVKDER